MTTPRISRPQARRLAVRATGLDRRRPDRPDRRHFRRVLRDVDVVQIDSVNVVDRAHHLLFHARVGAHDRAVLDDWLWRDAHECWAHVASLMPTEAWPLLAHRRHEHQVHPWTSVQEAVERNPSFVDDVLATIRDQGPVTVSDLAEPGERRPGFWGWGISKKVLHWLFLSGHIVVDHRDRSFRAAYDLPVNVLPADVATADPVPREAATRALALRAVRAQGVGTAASIADHHRQLVRETLAGLHHLEAQGEVRRVEVAGWSDPGWMATETVVPRVVRGRALVAPFDPLVWFRRRTERLFDMHYRIEIYVPEAQRQYGYYVMPFLLGDELVARVDCKSHRRRRALEVRGAWLQPGHDPDHVARELAVELRSLARHVVGTDDVEVVRNGDLADRLAPHV